MREFIRDTHFNNPVRVEDLKSFCKEHKMDWEMALKKMVEDRTFCAVIHPHQSCVSHFFTFIWDGFKRALPLYVPLHVVTAAVVLLAKLTPRAKEGVTWVRSLSNTMTLASRRSGTGEAGEQLLLLREDADGGEEEGPPAQLRGRRALMHHARKLLASFLKVFTAKRILSIGNQILSTSWRIIFNIMRSSLFLGVYCSVAWLAFCFAQKMSNVQGPTWVRYHIALSGLACLIEAKSRRIELAMYCAPHALSCAVNEAIKYNKLPLWLIKLKYHDIFIFCLASAIMAFCFRNEPKSIRSSFLFLMNWLWA